MSHYLRLEPCGLGTPYVESLGSYLHRLASAHTVSLYQFVAHLRHWWNVELSNKSLLPRHCDGVRFNGYSLDNQRLAAALEEGTSIASLAGCTLLPLRDVCAGNGIGALKKSRAWCPVCYHEAERGHDVIYDRLLWQIQGVRRCGVHGVQLLRECPTCRSPQRNQAAKTTLHVCERCGASLIGKPDSWILDQLGDVFEGQMAPVLEFTSANPTTTFSYDAVYVFCERMAAKFDRSELIKYVGDVFHQRYCVRRFQLTSIIPIAAFFGVPLISILQDPENVSVQLRLDVGIGLEPIMRMQRRYDMDMRRNLSQAIEAAIDDGPPYKPINDICELFDVSRTFAAFVCRDEVRRLIDLRRRYRLSERRATMARIHRCMRYLPSGSSSWTAKERHEWVATRARAPLNVVRKAMRPEGGVYLGLIGMPQARCWRNERKGSGTSEK